MSESLSLSVSAVHQQDCSLCQLVAITQLEPVCFPFTESVVLSENYRQSKENSEFDKRMASESLTVAVTFCTDFQEDENRMLLQIRPRTTIINI